MSESGINFRTAKRLLGGANTIEVSFDVTKTEASLIIKAVKRWHAWCKDNDVDPGQFLDTEMDLTACLANGCNLNLVKLLDFDEFSFVHDITGIRNCLNRKTGKLERCFLPRCAR